MSLHKRYALINPKKQLLDETSVSECERHVNRTLILLLNKINKPSAKKKENHEKRFIKSKNKLKTCKSGKSQQESVEN